MKFLLLIFDEGITEECVSVEVSAIVAKQITNQYNNNKAYFKLFYCYFYG